MAQARTQQKVLLVQSYHHGFLWSDALYTGLMRVLVPAGVHVETIWMDTKRRASEKHKQKAAAGVLRLIENYQPDVVIAADDNASKYVVAPHLKGRALPVVFCGVNWDASVYGFPASNVTGMVEVAPVKALLDLMGPYVKGKRVAFLGPDNVTHEKEVENIRSRYGLEMTVHSVSHFKAWKTAFQKLQGTTDLIMLENFAGIRGWDTGEAEDFVEKHIKTPTASTHDVMAPYSLISLAKSAEEQGEWSAQAALKILTGTRVKDIPLVENQRSMLYINERVAQALGVKFPALLKRKALMTIR